MVYFYLSGQDLYFCMGKKRIISKGAEELAQEGKKNNGAPKTADSLISSKNRLQLANIYIQATYNNVMVSIADDKGNVIAFSSAGAIGFSGAKKSTPFAAAKVVETALMKLKKITLGDLKIFVSGVGSGRESAIRAFASHGYNIVSIKDVTPVPHNGPRPKKVRRV